MEQVNLIDIAKFVVPIVIIIAKFMMTRGNTEALTPEEVAAIALFEALVAFLELSL